MVKLPLVAVSALSASMLLSAPAFAGTQDDVSLCRAALTEEGTLDMSNYRLSFDKSKGNRVRTLSLEAIPSAGGAKYDVKCTISKSEVTNLVVTEKA